MEATQEQCDRLWRLLHAEEMKVDALKRTVRSQQEMIDQLRRDSSGLGKVREWMKMAGQTVPDQFQFMDDQTVQLRMTLILEECMEIMDAAGVRLYHPEDSDVSEPLSAAVWLSALGPSEERYAELLDGLCDLLYVVYGTFVAMGLGDVEFFDEVHRSNMSKLDGLSHREDGKVNKGDAFSPPDLLSILKKVMG